MSITASMVKSLRERTGAGMMDCKKALNETAGDMDAAVEILRKKGAASADKKAGRIAAEGVIAIALSDNQEQGVLVEINSETDFVAKEPSFMSFAEQVASLVLRENPDSIDALNKLPLTDSDGAAAGSVDEVRRNLIAKIGENIGIRRFVRSEASGGGRVTSYLHGGGRIGALVNYQGGSEDLGKDVAMHVAALNPQCLAEDNMPADVLEKEKKIFLAQAQESGKTPEIAEKMVVGRMKKFLKENTLLGQAFVKDGDQTVAELLSSNGAQVGEYFRYEVGEGIDKGPDDFVSEVMALSKD